MGILVIIWVLVSFVFGCTGFGKKIINNSRAITVYLICAILPGLFLDKSILCVFYAFVSLIIAVIFTLIGNIVHDNVFLKLKALSKKTWKKVGILIGAMVIIILSCVALFNNYDAKTRLWTVANSKVESAEMYTPKTYEKYERSLKTANNLKWNLFADEETLNKASSDLKRAVDNLVLVPDKSTLIDTYENSINLDLTMYIPNCRSFMQSTLASAKLVIDDPNAISDDVSKAQTELDAAYLQLELIPDKTELQATYDEVLSIDIDKFLPSSAESLTLSLNMAKKLLDDENATISEVKDCLISISSAIELLVEKPNKEQLKATLKEAEEYNQEEYTTESYKDLISAIGNGNSLYKNENATKEEVEAATTALSNSIKNLEYSTQGVYIINISYSREYNNHVGNSWSKYCYYQGDDFSSGDLITAESNSYVEFSFTILERDSIPDYGYGYISVQLADGESSSCSIYVSENRGRYSGNTAKWIVSCKVTCTERI